jgi:glycosyltransferase involved in cell wall biosynthesis
MKICLFLPSFLPKIGGLEKAADILASILRARGHELLVLAQAPRRDTAAMTRPYPVRLYRKSQAASWMPLSPLRAMGRYHRQHGFDLLWAYQAYPQGYAAVRVGQRYGVPVVISSRGGDVSCQGRYLARWLPRRRIVWALHHADAVTTLNLHLAQRVEDLTGQRVHARIIFNGVEAPPDNPVGAPAPPALADLQGQPFILTLTRLRRFKGIDLIIEAVRLLQEQNRPIPRLVVTGSGQEEDALHRQVEESRLRAAVRFTGEVKGYDKAWLLANCLFLVQPSREGEGMPNSVLEAMSYGKPVLGAASPGLVEILHDGVNGLLVPPDEPAGLAEGLQRMLQSDLTRLGAAARKDAGEHSWEGCADQYLALFHEVLNARGRGRPAADAPHVAPDREPEGTYLP